MWFKQVQTFKLKNANQYHAENLREKLAELAFRPCLPSMLDSIGWVSPVDEEDAPLAMVINDCLLFCMQIEEKILPASVVRHELEEKVKQIELQDDRKVRYREKQAMKDELMMVLLPRAFTKFNRYYAYIDVKHQRVVFNTTQAKITEKFLSLFRKSVTEDIYAEDFKKLSPWINKWVREQSNPGDFAIEKACMLQDPTQESRVIRCKDQDLFAHSIQALIKDGCEVKQIALSWRDRVQFMLSADDGSIRSISYDEEIISQADEMEAETKSQQMIANFYIMSATLAGLLDDLHAVFKSVLPKNTEAVPA